jgi:DNA-binding NarL/FixJ family response regulator
MVGTRIPESEIRRMIYYLSQGYTTKEVADKMGLSMKCAQYRIIRLRHRQKARNTVHLVCMYLFDGDTAVSY